jgi:hypothetical protein
VAGRAAVAASFAVLSHLHWLWIPAAVLLESASMAAFAVMLRRLLAAGGASVGIRPMLATAYAANAVSVSVPLAGPALATAFTFRRFTRQGADAPLAGWSLLAGGVISSASAALVVVGGALASGNILVAAVAVPGGVFAVPETNLPGAPPRNRTPAMTADTRTTDGPARLAAHELVLLHGQPGSPADWQPVTARLPTQLHVIAADRPGYGSSRLPAGGFAANARAVLDDLDARGITRAVLVGHSYGGGVALAAAALAPRRVEAVILLASVGPGCVNGWDKLLAAPGTGRLCALVA